jgi:hypothetical protein
MNVYSDINEEMLIGISSSDDTRIVNLLQDLFGYVFELSDSAIKHEEYADFYKDTVFITSNHISDDLLNILIENDIHLFIAAL